MLIFQINGNTLLSSLQSPKKYRVGFCWVAVYSGSGCWFLHLFVLVLLKEKKYNRKKTGWTNSYNVKSREQKTFLGTYFFFLFYSVVKVYFKALDTICTFHSALGAFYVIICQILLGTKKSYCFFCFLPPNLNDVHLTTPSNRHWLTYIVLIYNFVDIVYCHLFVSGTEKHLI